MEESNSLESLQALGRLYAQSEYYVDKGKLKIHARPCTSPEEFFAAAQEVIQRQNQCFYFQAELGYILKSVQDQTYSLYYAGSNTTVMSRSFFVRKQTDKQILMKKLRQFDFHSFFKLERSGLTVEQLSYARFCIVQDYKPLGHYRNADLPAVLVNNRYVITRGNSGK